MQLTELLNCAVEFMYTKLRGYRDGEMEELIFFALYHPCIIEKMSHEPELI